MKNCICILMIALALTSCKGTSTVKKDVKKEATPPTTPTPSPAPAVRVLRIDDGLNGTSYNSPITSWNSVSDAVSYEVAFGSTISSPTDIKDWVNVGSSLSASLSIANTLIEGQKYYTSVRAIDAEGNAGPATMGDGWINVSKYIDKSSSLEINGPIYSMDIDKLGNRYLGGDFTAYNPVRVKYALPLNANGTINSSINFGTGSNTPDIKILPFSTGKSLVYGNNLTSFNGATVNKFHRLNANGSVDATFTIDPDIASLTNVYILDVKIDSSDNIYILMSSSTTARTIVKLDYSGVKNTTFSTNMTSNNLTTASSFELTPSGQSYFKISTSFFRLDADGVIDTGFSIYSPQTRIKILSNGNIILYGQYNLDMYNSSGVAMTSYKTNTSSYIQYDQIKNVLELSANKVLISYTSSVDYKPRLLKLNADGTKDTSFATDKKISDYISFMGLFPDGGILLIGFLKSFNGEAIAQNITKLTSTGELDSTFLSSKTGLSSNTLPSMAYIKSDNSIILSGYIDAYGGTRATSLLKLNSSNSILPFNTSLIFNNHISKVKIVGDSIWVLGAFTTVNNQRREGIAKLKLDGTLEANVFNGIGFNYGATPRDLIIQKDGKIVITGDFKSYNNFSSNNIVRLFADGSRDSSFVVGTGLNEGGVTLDLQSDNKILIGGNFTTYKGSSAIRVARLNTNGSLDTTFNTGAGFDYFVEKIKVLADGKIFAAGWFSNFNNASTNMMAKLNSDGSISTDFQIANISGIASEVYIEPNGQILVAGYFDSPMLTVPYSNLLRFNSDGSVDPSFESDGLVIDNTISAILRTPEGKILMGGSFNTTKNNKNNFIELGW